MKDFQDREISANLLGLLPRHCRVGYDCQPCPICEPTSSSWEGYARLKKPASHRDWNWIHIGVGREMEWRVACNYDGKCSKAKLTGSRRRTRICEHRRVNCLNSHSVRC